MDEMNLDDFVLPDFANSPSGQDPSMANAIPIKARKDYASYQHNFPAGSVPVTRDSKQAQEFGYVQKHVRKTSIDDRNVGLQPVDLLPTTLTFIDTQEACRFLPSATCY